MPYSRLTKEDLEDIKKLREEGWSLPKLGRKYGYKDHTTIMHYLRGEYDERFFAGSFFSKGEKKEYVRRLCSVPRCERNHSAKGFCKKHYSKSRRKPKPKKYKDYVKETKKREVIRDAKGHIIKVVDKSPLA